MKKYPQIEIKRGDPTLKHRLIVMKSNIMIWLAWKFFAKERALIEIKEIVWNTDLALKSMQMTVWEDDSKTA